MDITLLDTLRYKLEFAKDLSEIYTYFLDHFGEHPEFFDVCVPTQNEKLVTMIGQIGSIVFKKKDKIRLDNLMLMLVPAYDFIHGGCTMQGYMANVIYFDDIQKGLLAITRLGDPKAQFCRFSMEQLGKMAAAELTSFKH